MIIADCECGNRARAGSDKCATCETLARKEEKNSRKFKVASKIKIVSDKRAGELREYYALAKEFLIDNPCCMVKDCYEKSAEVHHKQTRTNFNLLDVSRFFGVCHTHHIKITEDSRWAKDNGYSELRTTNHEKK